MTFNFSLPHNDYEILPRQRTSFQRIAIFQDSSDHKMDYEPYDILFREK